MRKFALIGIFLTVLADSMLAQSRIIDSLKTAVSGSKDSTKKVDVLMGLVRIYFNEYADYENALKYTNEAVRISWQIGDTAKIIKTGWVRSLLWSKVGLIDESLEEAGKILSIARRHNSDQLMHLTNIIGMNLTLKARYKESLKFLSESLELRKESNDTVGYYSVIANIGVVFYKMKLYERALEYFKEVILTKKSYNKYFYDNVLINAGLCEAYLGRYPEALKFMSEGMAFNRISGSIEITIGGYFGLGLVYLKMGDLIKAKINFSESLRLALQQNDTRFIAEDKLYLGKIAYKHGNRLEALAHLVDAERTARKFEYNELLITIYEELIAIFKQEQNDKSESIYRDKFIQLKATVYNASLTEGLAENEAVLRSKQNIERIQLQNQILKLNSGLLVQQRILILLSCIVAVLFAGVFYALYLSNRDRKNLNSELERNVETQTVSLTNSIKRIEMFGETQKRSKIEMSDVIRHYVLQLKGLYHFQATGFSIKTSQKMGSILNKIEHSKWNID